ncbi:WXG100 family type VII secretion target [Gordonia sp. HY285]|uniref:WXG100 family type VII secretion target n=1 Tax=Gordonia liuliyuniae TaxID=2911517 RepID=UPI001F2302CA|nr:WXG100 family type VII secretion target [Gordonia liuliyuniae]MCF8609891.1 WXG100 family type VII secretion target [Gordonia liuliyuniae]
MTTGLNVDLGASQASTASIKGIVGEMQGIISRIQSAAGTGQSTWDGKASNAFGGSHADWHGTATRLQHALDEIEAKLTTGFRGYDDEDATAATMVGGSGNGTLAL